MISHSDLSHNELCKTIDTKDIMKLDRDCFPFYLHIFEIAPSVFKFTELLKSQDKNIMKKKKEKPRSTSNMQSQNDWKYYNS